MYGIDLVWIVILLCGVPIFKEAVIGLITKFDIKADVLVTIAIISSIIIGELFAAGVVAFIMAIGGFLEEHTVAKTKSGIEKIVNLTPSQGRVIRNYNLPNEKEEMIPADKIEIKDIIKVIPGEVIPVDGKIIYGESSIDQSVMTGESIPVDKVKGDNVYSGTINLYGSFIMEASKKGEDSSLQRLINLVESANPENAKIVKSADKWATWIVVIAFIAAIGTYILTGEIIRSVTILVTFCPCALVLATPTAIMAALGNLTNVGILVKEGLSIEKLAKINKIVFDKTGTLTYGKPEVIDIIPEKNIKKDELIYLLTSLESPSEHPLAKSIIKYYKENYTDPLEKVENFKIMIGRGVRGTLNENLLIAGNKEFMEENNIKIREINRNDGSTSIYLGRNSEFLGTVILNDKLKEDAYNAIYDINRLNVDTILLTGDNEESAKSIYNNLPINDFKYECLPEDKLEIIKSYQKNNNYVAMIGDGINDAPSLKQSNIGISMGNIGSDIAIEASDVCLISDDIKYLPHLLTLSRKTLKTINIAIGFSLSLNFLAMFLAMVGLLGPIGGALIHNIGSVIVIIYCASLWNYKYSSK